MDKYNKENAEEHSVIKDQQSVNRINDQCTW